jgi:hypothetical protein
MPARPNSTDDVIGDLRHSIAYQAARLIAEEGIEDYAFAKRKAARRLGVPERDLPSNAEVEAELKIWRAVFRDDDDDERLQRLRAAAVEVLRLLALFRPYVTGAVIDGLVDAFSEVEVEVYADSAKDVEIFLLGREVPYEHRETRRGGHDAPEAILVFECDEVPVKVSVYSQIAERTPRRSHSGAAQEKMRLETFLHMLGASRGEA